MAFNSGIGPLEYLKLLDSDELLPELVILRDHIALSTELGMRCW
jgi:hypothetical protein